MIYLCCALVSFNSVISPRKVPATLKNEETVARVVDMVTRFLKDLKEGALETVLNFAHKLNDVKEESEVFNIVRGKLRKQMEIFKPLIIDIERNLDSGPWRLGDNRGEKINLIILICSIYYTKFVLSYVQAGRDQVQEYLQSVNADESRKGVLDLQKSGNEHFSVLKRDAEKENKIPNFDTALQDYNKALSK